VHPGDDLDRLSLGAVPGDRTQLVGVGAHHVGQHVCVGRVALGPGHREAFAVAGGLQRVDRVHRIPGGDQRLDPRTPVGFDPDRDLPASVSGGLAELRTDHGVQPGDARHAFGQPGLGQPVSGRVHQLDVVMVLGPVISHEQQRISHPRHRKRSVASRRTISDLMKQCSRPNRAGTTSHQRSTLPTDRQGHDLSSGLHVQEQQVLTRRRLPTHQEFAGWLTPRPH
jgi:hypothetical protein